MNPALVRQARRVDAVWRLLALLARERRVSTSIHATSAPINILILDLHLIGDVVMLVPFLEALKRRYPNSRITLVAGPWSHSVLAGSGVPNEVIEFVAPWVKSQGLFASTVGVLRLLRRLRREQWDLGVDMRGDIRNILILFFSKCVLRVGFDFTGGAALLAKVVPDDGNLASILEHHERLAACLDAFDGRPFVPRMRLSPAEQDLARSIPEFVGFHFGASVPLRRLPTQEAAALLGAYGRMQGTRLVVFGAPDIEAYVAQVLDALDPALRQRVDVWRGDLRGFVVMASRASVMYTMDSGPAHLAAAIGCPTIVFFGPNRAAYSAPRGANVRTIELTPALPCQPCDQRQCVHPTTQQACLRGLLPEALRAASAFTERPTG